MAAGTVCARAQLGSTPPPPPLPPFTPPPSHRDSGRPWKSPYPFGPAGRTSPTSKWLLVERGHSQRCYPMALVRGWWGVGGGH